MHQEAGLQVKAEGQPGAPVFDCNQKQTGMIQDAFRPCFDQSMSRKPEAEPARSIPHFKGRATGCINHDAWLTPGKLQGHLCLQS